MDSLSPGSGTLYGVGVGPGDPDLLTLKAVRVIGRVPVLAYPAPLDGVGMARTIVAPHLTDGERIEVPLRMSFDPDRVSANAAYDTGAEAIAGHLAAGRDVAVLCEGDPLFFGTFIYVLARLGDRFRVEVVPGVSSVAACSALARRPFAFLDDRAAVIPATLAEDAIEAALAVAEAAAIIKVGRHLPKIARVLTRLDCMAGALYVERVGLPGERLRPFADVVAGTETAGGETAAGPYFSMVLVHKRGDAWR